MLVQTAFSDDLRAINPFLTRVDHPFGIGEVVDFLNVGEDVFEVDVQIDKAAGTQVEDPAVNNRVAVEQVSFLHARHFDDVEALFLHVQFDQAVVAQVLVFDCVQFFLMQAVGEIRQRGN